MSQETASTTPSDPAVAVQRHCSPFVRTDESNDYSRSAIYAVHGFWSGDNVRVSQRRHYKTAEWEPKTEPDNLKAAKCFALAIMDAVSVARQWESNNSDH